MVTIGMNYTVKPGKEEVFERAFGSVLETLKQARGHTHSHLYRDTQTSGSYLILSEWSDQAEFDAFIASDAFKRVTNWGKEQILVDRPRHQVYSCAPLH